MKASSDKLWPVLLALFALLSAAGVLEVTARHRVLRGRVVVIADLAGASVSDDDDEASGVALEASPLVDEDHARARLAARRGQLDEAMALYERASAAHPRSARLHAEMGYWWLSAGDALRARGELEQAAALAGDDPWIAFTLGVAHARLGDAAGAETLYRRALELKPAYGSARLALGTMLNRRGRHAEAIAMLEPAARSGSNAERAHALVELGRAQLRAGARGEAETSFRRAVEHAPADASVYIGTARAWMGGGEPGDPARAGQVLARAADIAPDVPQVFGALGRVHEKQGNPAAAEADFERALRLDPDYRYARRRLLRLALDRQDHPRARLHAEYLLAASPELPEHHFLAGLVAARDGRKDDARTHYGEAIRRAGGDYPEAYFNLGLLEKGDGQLDASIAAYRKAIALRADYVQAYNNLGLALVQAGDQAGAEATFGQALAIDRHYAAAWLNLGELYLDQKRHEQAIAAFQAACEARPGYAQARLDLGVAFTRAGRLPEAIATYRELVAAEPRYVAGWYNLGLALEAAADDPGAADAYRQALALDADHLASLRRLGDLQARRGQTATAMQLYEEVLDRVPEDREARLALARQLERRGDLAACAHEARAVLGSRPQDPEAARLVTDCTTDRK